MRRRAWIRKARNWFLDQVVWRSARISREAYDRERSSHQSYMICRIRVYGNPRFVEQIKQALARLEAAYPAGYSLVQRYVYAIEQDKVTEHGSFRVSTLIGIGVRSDKTTNDDKLLMTPERYGAVLVRFAADRRRILFNIPRSDRAEALARKSEHHAMELLLKASGF